MKNPVSVFDTLYDTLNFLRDPSNIKPERQESADELAEEVGQLGSAIERIVSAARAYHRLIRDEAVWGEPGVASSHAEVLGLAQSPSYEECLMRARTIFQLELADVREG